MPIPSSVRAAVLAVSFAVPLAAHASGAAAVECEKQISKVLQEMAIPEAEVKSVEVVQRAGGAKSASIYRLDAWVRLNSCSKGALIVQMTRYCVVQQSYTTGDCRVEGVSSY